MSEVRVTPTPADLPKLPARARDSHKGTAGAVVVVGGSTGSRFEARMVGAPALSALSALRAGAGLARLVMPETILNAALTICPSATALALPVQPDGFVAPHEASAILDLALYGQSNRTAVHDGTKRRPPACHCLAIGPGLGQSPAAMTMVLRAIQQEELPVVLDADALNCLAAIPEVLRDFHAAAVLTPHPGEFLRLAAGLGLKGDLGLAESRERAATELAQRLGRIVVLKGAGTVVSDGQRTWTNPSGHPCMATAGSGDILTGILAGLIAQFVPPLSVLWMRSKVPQLNLPADRPLDLFDAARISVFLHGLAGELWAAEHGECGMLAAELADLIPAAGTRLKSMP